MRNSKDVVLQIIASKLSSINIVDMTKAEKQICDLLVKNEYLTKSTESFTFDFSKVKG